MQASGFGPGPRALTLQPEGDGSPVRVIKSELLSPTRVLRHKRWRLGFLLFMDTTGLYLTSREVISPHLIIQISLLLLIKLNSCFVLFVFLFPWYSSQRRRFCLYMLVPQSCEGDRGCAERGLLQVREGGWLRPGVPTGAISDGTFCEFYIGLRTLRDHYVCKESTV